MDFDKSRIERLKRSLYSRDESMVPREKRTPVRENETDVPKNWGEEPSFEFSPEEMTKKNNSFFNKFFIGSIIFFVLSLGAASFIFFGGLNLISSSNVDISIAGPSNISSGEELDFVVSVVNGNRVDLENVVLTVEYPDGTRAADDNSRIISRDRLEIGTLEKNSRREASFRVSVFGEKDSIKPVILRISYNVSGSNAVFSKEKVYEVLINSSPILLNVSYPREINSGQEITFSIDVTSNSVVPIENTLVKVEYPYGFTFKDSSISPSRDDFIWNLGTLRDGDKKTLTVTGSLIGQNLEDRSFRISVGSRNSSLSVLDFDTDLAVEQPTIGIRRSFFGLSLNTPSNLSLGSNVSMDLSWQNTLPERLNNGRLEVVLSGNALDRNSITAGSGGFFRSVDNTIVWDRNTTPNMGEIISGSSGRFNFSARSVSDISDLRSLKNPHIDIKATMYGDRTTGSETISSVETASIKFKTSLNLTARAYRTFQGMTNTGPIPPKADNETTYTINWILTNTVNDARDVVVTAQLPVYVTWKGESTPGTENITYNPETRRITWSVGSVSFGSGFLSSPKQVSFKVGLTPSVNQVGSTPELIFTSSVSGRDTYTEENLTAGAPVLNTVFSGSDYVSGYERVVN